MAALDALAQQHRQTAEALLAEESQAQRDRLRVTLSTYGVGFFLVIVLLVASRVLGDRDAKRRAEIAERQRSLDLLRQSEEQHRHLVEASPVAMVVLAAGIIVYANEALSRLLGVEDRSSLAGRHVAELLHPASREAVRQRITKMVQTGASEMAPFEERLLHANGESIPAEITVVSAVFDGKPVSVATVRDLSAQKNAEKQRLATERELLEAQKLESLAVLAGGVAHDFNNLLVGILGNAGLAINELPDGSPAIEMIRDIEVSAQRAAGLSRQMLAYSGKGRFVVECLDINEMVEETSHLALASTSKHATAKYDFGDGTPAAEGDATQLRQVIMNLVMNASDAIGEGHGVITISTRTAHIGREALCEMHLGDELPEGEYVSLEVTDTGSGMAPEVMSRIFEPFFTTKFSGRGRWAVGRPGHCAGPPGGNPGVQ
jgi:PAS domain S-box-containing protein